MPLLRGCQDIFASGYMHPDLCSGLISLIPKGGDPTQLREWRPITLLPTVYKILALMISHRLCSFLPDIIHSSQTGFSVSWMLFDAVLHLIDPCLVTCTSSLGTLMVVHFAISWEQSFPTKERDCQFLIFGGGYLALAGA